jgi:hypothetical protein
MSRSFDALSMFSFLQAKSKVKYTFKVSSLFPAKAAAGVAAPGSVGVGAPITTPVSAGASAPSPVAPSPATPTLTSTTSTTVAVSGTWRGGRGAARGNVGGVMGAVARWDRVFVLD